MVFTYARQLNQTEMLRESAAWWFCYSSATESSKTYNLESAT